MGRSQKFHSIYSGIILVVVLPVVDVRGCVVILVVVVAWCCCKSSAVSARARISSSRTVSLFTEVCTTNTRSVSGPIGYAKNGTDSRDNVCQVVQAHPVAPAHVVDDPGALRVEAPHEGQKRRLVLVGLGSEPAPVVVGRKVGGARGTS